MIKNLIKKNPMLFIVISCVIISMIIMGIAIITNNQNEFKDAAESTDLPKIEYETAEIAETEDSSEPKETILAEETTPIETPNVIETNNETNTTDGNNNVETEDITKLFSEYSEPKTLYATTYLNMRDYPDVNIGNVIKVLNTNTEVTAIADYNGWAKILWVDANGNNQYYYLSSRYLSTEKQKIVTNTTPNTNVQNNNTSSGNTYLGNFKLTAYCNCAKCCGKWANGLTASGTYPAAGRTVAMAGVPFGTKLLINGTVYTVEDRGTAYGHVDIYFNTHSEALNFGMRYADVYMVN